MTKDEDLYDKKIKVSQSSSISFHFLAVLAHHVRL